MRRMTRMGYAIFLSYMENHFTLIVLECKDQDKNRDTRVGEGSCPTRSNCLPARFTVASDKQRTQGQVSILAYICATCPDPVAVVRVHLTSDQDFAMRVQYIVFLALMATASAKAWYLVSFADNNIEFKPVSNPWQPAVADFESPSKKSQTTKTDDGDVQKRREEMRRLLHQFDWSDENSMSDEDSNSYGG
ncbi:uncharacterized protein [Penaeus vannamei]|uniref:uncharacterized protein n=1 Tax=Penaeus vannamei TaxID=6689 RepID=UPI00387F937F